MSASEKEIIITHGTDTLIETGIWLQNQLNPVSNGVKGKNWKMCNLTKLLLHFKFFWNYLCMKELREKEGKYDFKKLWFMQLMTRYLSLHYFFLQDGEKIIILTGSFLPEKFKNSDADFNLGFTIGALQIFSTSLSQQGLT